MEKGTGRREAPRKLLDQFVLSTHGQRTRPSPNSDGVTVTAALVAVPFTRTPAAVIIVIVEGTPLIEVIAPMMVEAGMPVPVIVAPTNGPESRAAEVNDKAAM